MRTPLSGTKRKDGRWAITLTLTDIRGVKSRKTIYAATQREVQKAAQAFIAKNGRTNKDEILLSTLVDLAFESRWNTARPKTIDFYKRTCKLIVATIGDIHVLKIDPPMVHRWLYKISILEKDDGRLKYSGRSIQMMRNTLAVLLGFARELGFVETNAAKDVRLPRPATPKPRRAISQAEYEKVLAKETNPMYRLFFRIVAEAGLRPSEALAATNESVFYSHDRYWLRVGVAKTDAGTGREVPIPGDLGFELSQLPKGLLLRSDEGTPLNQSNLRRAWVQNSKDAKVEPVAIYELRKLCLSRWIAQGLPPDVVKTMAGHTDIKLTMNVYNRVGRDRISEAVSSVKTVSQYVNPLDGGEF